MHLTIVTDFDMQRAGKDVAKAIRIAEKREREREAVTADVGKPAVPGAKGAVRPSVGDAGKPG